MLRTLNSFGVISYLLIFSHIFSVNAAPNDLVAIPGNVDWGNVEPVETTPVYSESVQFTVTDTFLSTPGIMRRDPSDVIFFEGKYYVFYTKIPEGNPGYPGGWTGTVWYASSEDGKNWKEEGLAVDAGSKEDWDGAGAYTPNVLMHDDHFYLAYTAMPFPYVEKFTQASIGMAIAKSPKGPWKKLQNNPIISPGNCLESPDGFLTDDASFVVQDNKILLYYKGYPYWKNENDNKVRAGGNTYTMVASAEKPEGPYTKYPLPLHRGHEVVVWKDQEGITSLGIAFGEHILYRSSEGFNFRALHPLILNKDNFKIKAAGIFRQDFGKAKEFQKPVWGVCMSSDQGLARFEFCWP